MLHPSAAALIDLGLIALFGLQHSVMARPWFKKQVMRMPAAFERCTFVHMANFSLFALILFWQQSRMRLVQLLCLWPTRWQSGTSEHHDDVHRVRDGPLGTAGFK